MKEQCVCEFEELYKGQNNKLFVLDEADSGGKLFRTIKPNYCPVCGKELPEEQE